ncbi:hypothetical protein N5079_28445 [Planotetraspora sp. A-T 1434]|uniref:hypothetical protein n=1 Tax=Planotetraspora sp. A-T 1434 TaxID=2979219 RepID=UPI0021BE8EDE|nr:hypothetical protein [Planotetraspora sp. A-T 1434]MCT9934141.1 hypothetical protein [Planotetraspora sp. A-T 1434]
MEPHEEETDYWVFAQPAILSARELAGLNRTESSQDYPYSEIRWFRSHGGVTLGDITIKLVLQGARKTQVRIIGMRALPHCSSALRGTFFNSPSAGSAEVIGLGFDLNERYVKARNLHRNGELTGDYFADRTILLKHNEEEVFKLHVNTADNRYCEFRIQISVLDNGRVFKEIVDDHGMPFRVTAYIGDGNDEPEDIYPVVYNGGVLTSDQPWELVKPKPKTKKR